MRKSEIILLSFAILCAYLKSISFPGGAFFTTMSLGVLTLLYNPMGFIYVNDVKLGDIFSKASYSDITGMQILQAILIGMSLAVSSVAMLFVLQSWPGGNSMLLAGLLTNLLVGVIFFIKFFNTPTVFYRRSVIRIGVWLIVDIFLFFF